MSTSFTIHPSRPSISLTNNDSAVLQALFDAESSPSNSINVDPKLPSLPPHLNISKTELTSLQSREKDIISTLQPQDGHQSDAPVIDKEAIRKAINALDDLISGHPTYPSAYANRAQALRMLLEAESASITHSTALDAPTAANTTDDTQDLEDQVFTNVTKAIALASPQSPADPVSPFQARLLADSYTHRGYLILKLARDIKNGERGERKGGRFKDLDADQLEEMASRDFFFGGKFGNKIAQQLAVQTNPYAKMCGAIVKEAIREEMKG